jgi:hypothetical protein
MRTKTTSRTPKQEAGMVRGTILVLRRRCGKAQCRCAEGEPHVSWALSYSVKGRTRMLCVGAEELPALRRDLARYRAAVTSLEREALAGIAQWRRRKS